MDGAVGSVEHVPLRSRALTRPGLFDRHASAHGQRHKNLLGRSPYDVEHDVPALVASRNVEKHQLVRPFCLVPGCYFHGIARIAKVQEVDLDQLIVNSAVRNLEESGFMPEMRKKFAQ